MTDENKEHVLNLDQFREITGGDPDVEKELFTEFQNGTDSQFKILEETWDKPERKDEWSGAGHAIKGNSLMLGAERLAALGKHAQFNPDDSIDAKKQLLAYMQQEYVKIKEALKHIHQ